MIDKQRLESILGKLSGSIDKDTGDFVEAVKNVVITSDVSAQILGNVVISSGGDSIRAALAAFIVGLTTGYTLGTTEGKGN